jgi:hypothetical protein
MVMARLLLLWFIGHFTKYWPDVKRQSSTGGLQQAR